MRLVPVSKLVVLCVTLALAAGCYVAKVPLGPLGDAVTDPNFVGYFENKGKQLYVGKLDGGQYYVEFWGNSDGMPSRMFGHVNRVGGALFASLKPITDDGTDADEWIIVRIDAGPDSIELRHLDDDFFDGKDVDTSEKLAAVVAENVENAAMYKESERETMLRVIH